MGKLNFFLFLLPFYFFISWMIKYPDIISTQVEVTSQHPPVYLVSRTNGKVNELNVLDGNEVKKDSWLAIIENPAKNIRY